MPNNESNRNDSLKEIHTTFDSDGSVKSSSKKGGVIPKVLSVLAAIALWLYVFQAVEYEKTFNDITIEIEESFDSDSGLGIVNNHSLTVDVTISGTKSNIDKIKASDIRAYVDMNGVDEADTYTREVKIEAPSTVEVIHRSLEQLRIEVDKTGEKSVHIETELNYSIQQPYELGEIVLTDSEGNPLNEIKLTGPESDIVSIKKARIKLDIGNSVKNTINSNVNTRNSIILLDGTGREIDPKYISIAPSSISVHIPVYRSKIVDIKPSITVDESKFEYTYTDEKVEIYGPVNEVEHITYLKTEDVDITIPGPFVLPLAGIKIIDNNDDNESEICAYKVGSKRTKPVTSISITVTEIEIPEPEKQETEADKEDTSEPTNGGVPNENGYLDPDAVHYTTDYSN